MIRSHIRKEELPVEDICIQNGLRIRHMICKGRNFQIGLTRADRVQQNVQQFSAFRLRLHYVQDSVVLVTL